jgi:hypothetical protein
MAGGNLLETSTVTFLGLIGNGRVFRVPAYQRDYSWGEEQWEDLWADIVDLRMSAGSRHYMGALVVEPRSDRELLIIDGQQRIATLSVLALAVLAQLNAMADAGLDPEGNRARSQELRNRFIGERDPASLVESSKLTLNETDNAFYQDNLVQLRPPLNARALPQSCRLLWDCFRYFRERIAGVPELAANGVALAQLLSETVARQLLFIQISVADDLNAYTVFETLNARGLELTTTDLLKNYLFSRVRVASDLVVLQRRWRSLVTTVEQERFPEFLRYHLLCDVPRIRAQRLFKLVRERVRAAADVFALLDALEGRAELFAALRNPNHGYWIERPEARPYVRNLDLFRVRQTTPVLFAAWERFSPEDFLRVLKLLSAMSFRYTVVSGLNTNALEPAFHLAAKAILAGRATRAADVFQTLREIYVDDAKFEADFANLSIVTGGQSRRVAKYVLAVLEEDASGRACDPETDPASIEHVLPENPLSTWAESIERDRWQSAVYRLGNLTFLRASANRDAGNASYADKRPIYAASEYALTRHIVEIAPHEWTLPLIDARQRLLAARAVHLWRSDYA